MLLVFYNDTRVILGKIDNNFSCEVEDFLCCDNNHLFDIDIYYNEIVLALQCQCQCQIGAGSP